jgi:putative flippase GtrA
MSRPPSWSKLPALAEFSRFGAVGVLSTALYLLSTMLLGRFAHLTVAAAAGASFLFVVTINYLLHYSWTFRSDRPHSSTLPRFIATAISGMAINSAVLLLGARYQILQPVPLLLLGVCLVVVWNFLLSKFWVFIDASPNDDKAGHLADRTPETGGREAGR